MKKPLILLILAIHSTFLFAQIVLTTEGTIVNNTEPASWVGFNIRRYVPTASIFRNNSITSVNASGYMLQAGDESLGINHNNLDGQIITGNKFTWNGTDLTSITNGMITGFNKNCIITYNYLNKTPMGIIRKSDGMTNTSGGIAYNIIIDPKVAVVIKGMNNVNIYNNTIYCTKTISGNLGRGLIDIYNNTEYGLKAPSTGTKIFNNIFYTKQQVYNIRILDSECISGFESDYNIFWCEAGAPLFYIAGNIKTFAQWQALGYDKHSVVINPNFIDFTNFVPNVRLDYGINLGSTWQTGLTVNAVWGTASPATTIQNGTWQVGARIYNTTVSNPPVTNPPVTNPPVTNPPVTNNTTVKKIIYYIDPSGNNSNDGSAAHPWLTLAYACTRARTQGDIIHVNPGTYTEKTQSALAVGVSIEGAGNNSIITTNAAFNPLITLISSNEGTNGNQSISYIKMDGDLICKSAVLVSARSNVEVHHCWFIDFDESGVTFSGKPVGYSNSVPNTYATGNKYYSNTMNNCAKFVSGYGEGGLRIGGQDGMLIYNNTITQTERTVGNNGYPIKYYYGGNNKGVKIYDNIITKSPNDGSNWGIVVELWYSQGGIEIFNNVISGAIDLVGNYKNGYDYSVYVHHNIIGPVTMNTSYGETGLDIEHGAQNLIICNNYIRNCNAGIAFSARQTGLRFENIYIYNNIINGVGTAGQLGGEAISWDGNQSDCIVNNINICNNVINKGSVGHGFFGIATPTGGTVTNISIRNNIIVGFERYPVRVNKQVALTMNVVSIENNIMYGNLINDPYFIFTPTNLTNKNNIKANPVFVTAANFHLNTGSPGIGKGLKIPTITTDYDELTYKDPPSIGSYEYTSNLTTPVIPVYQNSATENATPNIVDMAYDLSLSNIIPAATAFTVKVNGVRRNVSSVAISANKVRLTLTSSLVFGDIVIVEYTKPATNQLQSVSGGKAVSVYDRTVTNKVGSTAKNATLLNDPPVLMIKNETNSYSGFVWWNRRIGQL